VSAHEQLEWWSDSGEGGESVKKEEGHGWTDNVYFTEVTCIRQDPLTRANGMLNRS